MSDPAANDGVLTKLIAFVVAAVSSILVWLAKREVKRYDVLSQSHNNLSDTHTKLEINVKENYATKNEVRIMEGNVRADISAHRKDAEQRHEDTQGRLGRIEALLMHRGGDR